MHKYEHSWVAKIRNTSEAELSHIGLHPFAIIRVLVSII